MLKNNIFFRKKQRGLLFFSCETGNAGYNKRQQTLTKKVKKGIKNG